MTRPIDADALKELFIQTLENIKSNPRMTGQEMHILTAIHTVGQMIDDAPTVDAVPIAFIKSEIKNTQGVYSTSLRILLDTWAERGKHETDRC